MGKCQECKYAHDASENSGCHGCNEIMFGLTSHFCPKEEYKYKYVYDKNHNWTLRKVSPEEVKITVDNGKYTFVSQPNTDNIHVLKRDEHWLTIKDNHNADAVLILMEEIEKLKQQLKKELRHNAEMFTQLFW